MINLYNIDYYLNVILQNLLYDRSMYGSQRYEKEVKPESGVYSGRTTDEEQSRTDEADSEAPTQQRRT